TGANSKSRQRMPNRFRRRHLLQTGRHLTEKSRMLTLPGLPVNPAHPGSRLLARRIRAGATGSPDAKNHPAAKRRRVSTNKNKTAARNHREKHSQNISHPKNRIKRSGAMHFRMAPPVFRVSASRAKDRGREQSLPVPVRKTTAGNSHCRPLFEIPRPETVTAGPPCVRHYPPSGLDDYLVQEVFDFPGLIVFKSEYVGDVAFLIQIVGSDDAEFAALCVEHQAFSEVAV